MFLKVVACEIAARELYYAAARSPHQVDLEFLTQGHHDTPATGKAEVQKKIEAVPAGKYDAVLLGYGLCSNILAEVRATHTRLVVPRAHDCITFFMGSKERYQKCFTENPGTFYYSSGWLECARRRGVEGPLWGGAALPATATMGFKMPGTYTEWVIKYGEDQAKYLLEEMSRWTEAYSNGTLIEFDFLKHLNLDKQVQGICAEKKWAFGSMPGDMRLFDNLLNGIWPETDYLVVQPGEKIVPSFDDRVIKAVAA